MRKRKNKKYSVFIMMILVIISFSSGVNMVMADAYHNDLRTTLASSYYFYTTNYGTNTAFRVGVKGWSSGTPYKGTDPTGKTKNAKPLNAYCVTMNHSVGFKNGRSYKDYCTKAYIGSGADKLNDKQYIIAGRIVEIINADTDIKASDATMMVGNGSSTKSITTEKICNNTDGCTWSDRREYAYFVYKVLTLNTYFSRRGTTGSIDFTKVNSVTPRFGRTNDANGRALATRIQSYIDEAKEWYEKEFSPSIGKIDVSFDNSTVNARKYNNFYISNSTVKYTVPAKLTNGTSINSSVSTSSTIGGTISFCTDSSGNHCSASPSAGANYYIKFVPSSTNNPGGEITVAVNANANFEYPKLYMYCRTKDTQNQAIGVHGSYTATAAGSGRVTMSIPANTTKTLKVTKVNSSGEYLAGAKFELVDTNGKKYDLKGSADGKSFTYTSTDSSIDFSKISLILKEVTTPDGYTKSGDINVGTFGEYKKGYYETDDSGNKKEITEKVYSSDFVCKITTTDADGTSETKYDVMKDDSCDSYVSTDDSTTGTTIEDTTTATSITDGETTPSESKVTAEKVCAYKNENGSYSTEGLDNSSCDKSNKVKIESYGNYIFLEIPNSLNTVKISKIEVTGKKEVAGANLKICTKGEYEKNGTNCTAAKTVNNVELSWVSGDTAREFAGLPFGSYYILETVPPLGYKLTTTVTPFSIDKSGKITSGNTEVKDNTIVIDNTFNEITVSKTDIVTTKELPGAVLSICEAFEKTDEDTAQDDEDDDEITTATTTGDKTTNNETTVGTETSNDIVHSNNPADYDMVLDEEGDCVPVNLQDGSGQAVWISEDKPHKIQGLPTGTYYLVEKTAPNGYTTAESILFKMTDSGQLTDITGNPIKDNKIVMKDKSIEDVKTGKIVIAVTILFAISAGGLGIYYYSKTTGGTLAVGIGNINDKIRKRKIHK